MNTYAETHANRANLLIHLAAVPLFIFAHIILILALVNLQLVTALLSIIAIVVSMALQGRGHKIEVVKPEPFTGAANFVTRFYREQFYTFPKFVLQGEFFSNLRQR